MATRFCRSLITTFVASIAAVALLAMGAVPASAIGDVGTISVGNSPNYIAVTPDGAYAYVTNWASNSVSVIATATNTIATTIAVSAKPWGVAVSPNGLTVMVTHQSTVATIISTATNAVTGTVTVGSFPWDVAFSADSTKAFVPNYLGNSVSVITVATKAVTTVALLPGTSPQGAALSPDGATVWVAGTNSDTVIPINVASNAVGTGKPVGDYPTSLAFSPDGTTIYTTNANDTGPGTVSVLHVASGFVTDVIDVVNYPSHLSLSNNGSTAYVTGPDGAVSIVDLELGVSLDSVPVGTHPQGTAVNPVTGRVYVANRDSNTVTELGIDVERLNGTDRYDVGVKISQAAFPSGAAAVYVATGENYPDALSAGPAAALDGGPLLLNPGAALRADVKTEIQRLAPTDIYIVGGPNSISPAVEASLASLVLPGRLHRLQGADRYAASRAIASHMYPSGGATTAYITTGRNFPDALSASAAGASSFTPVILVDGLATTLDAPTLQLLVDLGVSRVIIAGGPASVSGGIETQLTHLYSTSRKWGADRFEASQAINEDAFSSSSEIFIATGYKFPDALAGSALAGQNNAPLFVVRDSCIPDSIYRAMQRLGADHVTLLGGPASLTQSVFDLVTC